NPRSPLAPPPASRHFDLAKARMIRQATNSAPNSQPIRQTRRHWRGLPVEKIKGNSDGASRCSATTLTPPSEMSVITQSRGKLPVPNCILARLLHKLRSLLRRFAANMSISPPSIYFIGIASGLHRNRWNRPSGIDRNQSIYFDFILAI